MPTVSRKIRTPDGREITLSSDDLEQKHLVLAEVILEMCAARGSDGFTTDDFDEIARRLLAKGYDPGTCEPIN